MKQRYPYLLSGLILVSLFLFLLPISAQDAEPTDRPFPGAAATSVEPTDRPFPGATATSAEPTERPFPVAETSTVEATESADVNLVDVETTPELLIADVQATADTAQAQIIQLEAEQDSLLAELDAAQADNGATLFALVIIVIGVLLALAVFFGLRRSGE